MTFVAGEIPEGATPFQPGQTGNPNGRPLGVKNRSTIARKVLEMKGLLSSDKMTALKSKFPEIANDMSVEEIMTIVMADNAIGGDDKSYKAVLDSAYGAPKQELEHSGEMGLIWQETKTYEAKPETDSGD